MAVLLNSVLRTSSLPDPSDLKSSQITFHNINYDVQVKVGKCCGGTQPKRILNDVSGIFRPGAMNAIMGATGSGKTSLLDVLAARKDPRGVSGTILIDGQPQPRNFKCMSGYVVQDDVVMGTLTVRENLLFSANLRLPRDSMTAKQRGNLVDEVINDLGLAHVAHSKVGTEFIRGVSGGERKRTNIGMELIITPSVLFLDEPTTGLDASTANTVMKMLYSLSRRGRTIIFSIHQPRYSIYRLFDQLMLLAKGKVVYHGPAAQTVDYFSEIGYKCEAFNNPPDFFLDLMNGDLKSARRTSAGEDDLENGNLKTAASVQEISASDNDELANHLHDLYAKSPVHEKIKKELDPIQAEYLQRSTGGGKVEMISATYNTGFWVQFYYVAKRTLINLLRNPQTSVMQLMIMIVLGLIVGLIYRDVGDDAVTGIQNRIGVFFFIVMNQIFGNLSAVELFIKERNIFIHENAAGFYSVAPYFLSKIVCDVIPMRIVPNILFSLITYFMIGLQMTPGHFFFFFLMLIGVSMAAAGVGFLFSSVVRVFALAQLGIALSYVFSMIFGGFLVNINTIDWWLQWIKYASLFRYALNGLYVNELKGLVLCDYSQNATFPVCSNHTSTMFLEAQDVGYKTAWDAWQNPVALFSMFAILMTGTYVALRRIKKYK